MANDQLKERVAELELELEQARADLAKEKEQHEATQAELRDVRATLDAARTYRIGA